MKKFILDCYRNERRQVHSFMQSSGAYIQPALVQREIILHDSLITISEEDYLALILRVKTENHHGAILLYKDGIFIATLTPVKEDLKPEDYSPRIIEYDDDMFD